jgi:hypothetical protein
MKHLPLSLLILLTITSLQAEAIKVDAVSQNDIDYLIRRVAQLEKKAQIWSHEWNVETSEPGKNTFLILEEVKPDGNFRKSAQVQVFEWEPYTNDRISILFQHDQSTEASDASGESAVEPRTIIVLESRTNTMRTLIPRVVEINYHQAAAEDGVICRMKTSKGTSYRLLLFTMAINDQSE